MFNYNRHPLNVWVYGLSALLILIVPLLLLLVDLDGQSISNDFFGHYLSVMLFPYDLSSKFLFQIPYLGVILAVSSFTLHIHVYSLLIERCSVLLRKS